MQGWHDLHGSWETTNRGILLRSILDQSDDSRLKITDLTPFWKDQTTYWSSTDNHVVDPVPTFNYSYGGGAESGMTNPLAELQATFVNKSGGNILHDWAVRVTCKKFELGGSFSVFIFLGEVPANPEAWFTDSGFVGTFDVFANSTPELCINCLTQPDDVFGFVPLNRAILEHSGQPSLEDSVVVPFLEKKLNWAICMVGHLSIATTVIIDAGLRFRLVAL